MGLTAVVDAIAAHLAATLPPPTPAVGPAQPATSADLPAVAISVTRAEQPLPALGRTPASVMTGALRVTTTIDLADPVLHLPGEDVSLLSPDRRVVHLPHGSVVRADGIGEHPFGAGDLLVRVGATTFPPVAGAPTAAQVQLDPQAGILQFLNPLPAAGTMELGYFIGAWEVRTERHQGEVELEVFAASGAAAADLSAGVDAVLTRDPIPVATGLRRVEPLGLGPITVPPAVLGLVATTRTRVLRYRFSFERIDPVIQTSGGPIIRVDVASTADATPDPPVTEAFSVE